MASSKTFSAAGIWVGVIPVGLSACAPVIRPTMPAAAAAAHMAEFWEAPILWALGYHQPPVYYLPSFTLANASGTHTERGGRFRLSDPSLKNRGQWSWQQNRFVGTAPYQGLLVILVTFNSADLKNENNTVYEVQRTDHDSERWYAVRDLGSSLGATGRFNPRENDPNLFERRGFITGVTDGYVEFDYGAINKTLVNHRVK